MNTLYFVSGVIGCLLLIYLFVALFLPEKF